jgi:hypothetical protein
VLGQVFAEDRMSEGVLSLETAGTTSGTPTLRTTRSRPSQMEVDAGSIGAGLQVTVSGL